jgi:hypothetical protein
MHSRILASCCERDFNRGMALFIALFNRKVILHLSWAFRRNSHSRAFCWKSTGLYSRVIVSRRVSSSVPPLLCFENPFVFSSRSSSVSCRVSYCVPPLLGIQKSFCCSSRLTWSCITSSWTYYSVRFQRRFGGVGCVSQFFFLCFFIFFVLSAERRFLLVQAKQVLKAVLFVYSWCSIASDGVLVMNSVVVFLS